MNRGKFFHRIYKLLIYIMLIIVTVFSICIFVQSKVMHREQTIRDKEHSLAQLKEQLDGNIYIIKRNIERYCNEPDVKRYMREISTYNRLLAADLLNEYFSSFGAIGINVTGYFPEDRYVLQDKLIFDKEQWLGGHGMAEYTHGLTVDETGFSAYKIIKNSEGISILWNPQNTSELLFIITFTDEYLKSVPGSEELSGFIKSKTSDICIFGDYDGQIPPPPKNPDKLRSGKYYYLYHPSEEFANMQYVYVMMEPLFRPGDFAVMSGLIILIALLCILFSYVSASFIYRPFGDTLKTLGKDDAVFDELDYLVCSSADMKMDNQRLLLRLEENRLSLKDKRLGEFVMGMMPPEEMHSMVNEYELDVFSENGCTVAIVDIEEFDNDRDLSAIEESDTFLKLLSYLKNNGSGTTEVFGQGMGRLVFLFASGDINGIKKDVNHIILDISDKFNVLSTGTVGNYSKDFFEVYNSYREAVRLFETAAFTFSEKNVISFDDIKNIDKKISYNYPMETESQLIRCISGGNYDKAMQMLKTVLDCNLQERSLREQESIEFRFVIAATIKRVLQCIGKTTEDIFGEGNIIYLEMSMCKNNNMLYDKIWEMFERIIDELKCESTTDDEQLIVKITRFIDKNFQRDLSLQEISDKFEVSTFYISRLFRLKRGITFKEYINSLRIDKAKQIMLDEPDITVLELAKRVGYNRSETFYRVFKSIEGDTPKGFLCRRDGK